MTTAMVCLQCDQPLQPSESLGLCARCSLKGGFSTLFEDAAASGGGDPNFPLFPMEFGRYRVVRFLGAGGMGAVYEAEEIENGRRVAMKVLGHRLDSPSARKRFLREGRIAAALNHPNTVYIFGTEEIEETPVITMEIVVGGTLDEQVERGGPRPIGEAVDSILQIVDGLSAASALEILHRDVKPQNCFVEPDGTVKVGDFGLSIDTLARLHTEVSPSGSGTPHYAPPEQLRGQQLDLRTDLYAVGATLFYLLTGQQPFNGPTYAAIVASVIGDAPPSPQALRPEIPTPLARVVLRCLEKKQEDRYQTYAELRAALRPFESAAPRPAPLTRRLAAGAIDFAAMSVLHVLTLVLFIVLFVVITHRVTPGPLAITALCTIMIAVDLTYFGLTEGLRGASPGKALLDLEVIRLDRNLAGFWRAFTRALIYLIPTNLALVPASVALLTTGFNPLLYAAGMFFYYAYPLLLCATARRSNGLATICDLLTGTRVVRRPGLERLARVTLPGSAVDHEPPPSLETLPQIGPYHVLGSLGKSGDARMLVGYDSALRRRVWIRQREPNAPPVTPSQRSASRPTRLRWLQAWRTQSDASDAYEDAPGAALVNRLQKPRPWQEVRHWLHDLAVEFDAGRRDGTLPGELRLDRVWITSAGRAKLLDFPAPGSQPSDAGIQDGPGIFLNQIAVAALEGVNVTAAEAKSRGPRVPLGLAARQVLDECRATPWSPVLAPRFRPLLQQLPAVSHRRRLALVAGVFVPALLFLVIAISLYTGIASLRRNVPDFIPLQSALANHWFIEAGFTPLGLDRSVTNEQVEIYMVARFGKSVREHRVPLLSAQQTATVQRIFAAHPDPSPEEIQRAYKALDPVFDDHQTMSVFGLNWDEDDSWQSTVCGMFFGAFLWPALFTLGAALLTRGGVIMNFLEIAVARRDGTPASHLRTFWRACIACSPMVFLLFLFAFLTVVASETIAFWVSLGTFLGLATVSAALPERSLVDRLSGTRLVPR